MVMRRVLSPLGAIVLAWSVTDFIRGVSLLMCGPLHTTSLSFLVGAMGSIPAAAVCIASAVGGAYAVLSPKRSGLGFFAILAQQAIMFVFAIGPVTAIIDSQYADGVLRSRGFLLADQLPHVTPVFVHMAAVPGYWLSRWAYLGRESAG